MSLGGRPSERREPPAAKTPAVFCWPCGCVTRDSRTGPLQADCGDPACYRRSARPVRRIRML